MRSDVLAYIRELSLRDPKTLSQKALKLMEEVGELAKVALPYDNISGTAHRFVTPERLLEEAVDSVLVALSIAYSLGYDDESITQEMVRKSDYWASLQARECNMTERTPYEIHITVAAPSDTEVFCQVCHNLSVKPVVLDLQAGACPIKDVMTSSVFFGKNSEAYYEMQRIADGLAAEGFEVVRRKIETVPWHPAAPSRRDTNPAMPDNCYFESHIAVRVENDAAHEQLKQLAIELKCHLSRNAFKWHEDGSVTVMMTYRTHDDVYETVRETVATLRAHLEAEGFVLDKTVIEFSLFDSRVSHDTAWLLGASR